MLSKQYFVWGEIVGLYRPSSYNTKFYLFVKNVCKYEATSIGNVFLTTVVTEAMKFLSGKKTFCCLKFISCNGFVRGIHFLKYDFPAI